MKKIVTILICVVFGVGSVFGKQTLYVNTKTYVATTGCGKVTANTSATPPAADNSAWKSDQYCEKITVRNQADYTYKHGTLNNKAACQWYSYPLFYHALPKTCYTVEGWVSNKDASVTDKKGSVLDLSVSNTTITADGSTGSGFTSNWPDLTIDGAIWYAVFKPIVSLSNNDTYNSEESITVKKSIGSNIIPLCLCNAQGLNIAKSGSENISCTILTNKEDDNSIMSFNESTTYTGTYYIKVTITGNATADDVASFTFSSNNNGGTATLNVDVDVDVTEIKVTFKSNPNLPYFVTDGGSGATYEINENSTHANQAISLAGENITLNVGNNGNRLYRYIIERDNTLLYLYNNSAQTDNLNKSFVVKNGDVVLIEEIDDDYARFRVDYVGEEKTESNYYDNLQHALDFATDPSVTKKIVYVTKSGNVSKRKDLDVDADSDAYIIPSGVTFLVPGDKEETCRTGALTTDDFKDGATGSTAYYACKVYKYIDLDDETDFVVNGNLCVYAVLSYGQPFLGMPTTHGLLQMGDGCDITLKQGAHLHVSGFIAGNPQKSKIIAEPGSTVYETLQIRDWCGGVNATQAYASAETFIVQQYYVQNIETTLRLECGAEEYVSTGVTTDATGKLVQDQAFIIPIPANPSGNEVGLVRLGANSYVEKYYDRDADRLCIDISGKSADSKGIAQLGNMAMSISDIVSINSKNYTLPINMNIGVTLDNVEVDNLFNIAMLAESKLSIKKGASLTLSKNLIVYDSHYHPKNSDQVNDWGFYRKSDQKSDTEAPIVVVSNIANKEYTYKGKNFQWGDAVIDVNGEIFTTSEGMLYTTSTSNLTDVGAKITSSEGGGKIHFQQQQNPKSETKQNSFKEGTLVDKYSKYSIPLTIAKLHNGGDNFVSYTTPSNNDATYIYAKQAEKWTLDVLYSSKSEPAFSFNIPTNSPEPITKNIELTFTAQADLSLSIDAVEKNGFVLKWDEKRWNGNILIIPVSYTQTNKYGLYSAEFTITDPTGLLQNSIDKITVTATENYAPVFTCSTTNGSLDIADFCNTKTKDANLVITPGNEGDNVTALLNTNSNLVWSYDIINDAEDNFDFTFGDAADLSKAVVTFKPTTSGTKTATLKITATSKFVATEPALQETVEVPLSATATLCYKPIVLHNIEQLFVGEENVALIADEGNGNKISIEYDDEYIELSPATGTDKAYTIKAKKAGTTTIKATQAASNEYKESNDEITIEILEAITWNWGILYYGATHTDPLIVDRSITTWSLTLEDSRPEIIAAFNAEHPNYTMSLPLSVIEGEQQVKFMFRSGDNEIPLFAELSDLRILTACVNSEASYNALSLESKSTTFDVVEVDDEDVGVVTFNSSSSNTSSWAMQFYGIPSKVTFTPRGANRWQILQGPTAASVTQNVSVNWASYPSGEEVTILLDPTTRFIKFEYGASSDQNNNIGTLSGICVHKMQMEAQTSLVYLPVGQTKQVQIMHTRNEKLVPTSDNQKLTCTASNPVQKNGYYESTFTLSATEAGEYSVTATENGIEITIQVIAFNFPMGLPIITDEWKVNTDKKHYYHFYVEESENVHWWNAQEDPYIVLEYTGNKDIAHSMTFAFEGAPSVIKFDYSNSGSRDIETKEWTVQEYNSSTSKWQNAIGKRTITGTHFEQELQYTTRKVRLIHKSDYVEESQVANLIIEGYPSVILNPTELLLSKQITSKEFTITAINLQNIQLQVDNSAFELQYQYEENGVAVWSQPTNNLIQLKAEDGIYPEALGTNKVGDIVVKVNWAGVNAASISEGKVIVSNLDALNSPLGTVKLLGANEFITPENTETGIWSGVPDGKTIGRPTQAQYYLNGTSTDPGSGFEPYTYGQVDVKNAFAEGKALFDYLIIYGETTTKDGNYTILEPNGTRGSNARTPYYIYQKYGDNQYKYVKIIDNANSPTKWCPQGDDDAFVVPNDGHLSVYITGFCPYASTGCTKDDEGIWFFRGPVGSRVDVYLEDCHIYSRNKTSTGAKYGKNDAESANTAFNAGVVMGSGAVLVFENQIDDIQSVPQNAAFNVAIHTIGHNILKSGYGIYNNPLGDAGIVLIAQVSSTVQVRLGHEDHYEVAKTVIDFDDKWPTSPARNAKGEYTTTNRTNGFLSLQKQANHAPSIDLGNANTEVNFRGGQVQLQNAEIVSPNYKTTLAISHRTGIMGNIKDFSFAYGLGTDDVGGTVNFYDGTTTVIPMEIDPAYRDFYLMDEDNPTRTSCLRTPANTFIYGGSHCMLRACKYVTSRGGAPKDGPDGNFLGLYKYPSAPWSETIDGETVTHKGGWTEINGGNGRVTIPSGNLPNPNYRTESITPNTNKTSDDKSDDYLNLWVPEGYDISVDIEVDKLIRTWLACMTEIQGGLMGVNARVGGDEYVGEDDEIHNLLYCQLDDYIYDVISETDGLTPSGDPNYTYSAPAIDPTSSKENPVYQDVPLTSVSDYKQHNIVSENDYKVTKKVYYVTTAQTDTWMNFTMPFDVEKIWMLEPYKEADIKAMFNTYLQDDKDKLEAGTLDKNSPNYLSPMERTKMWQAQHNADFAAFFGMAMAIGQHGKDFNDIYADYYTWAKNHADAGKYTGTYNLRGLYELEHYNGSNFTDSHYFLYKNMGDWTLNEYDEVAAARWEVAPAVGADSILMNKGETYSMLFPYCTGCDVQYEQDQSTGEWGLVVDNFGIPVKVERDYWDYWSGKILIFESTNGDPNPNTKDDDNPHVVRGSNYIAASKVDANTPWIFDGLMISDDDYYDNAVLTGNSTFSTMSVDDYEDIRDYMYMYNNVNESFEPLPYNDLTGEYNKSIVPTESFLVAHYHTPIRLITRNGRVITEDSEDQGNDNSGTTTGGHMPTVGGGHDMFITGTDGGINVAVANPQQVFVISATGTILYSGYVNDNVDIPLPINGIYIVKGETEVQKIFY